MTKQTPADAVAFSIANEVRAELARQQKTAAELAEVLKVTPHTMGRRLKGATPFNVVELMTAVTWLGLTLEELIHRAEHAEKKTAA